MGVKLAALKQSRKSPDNFSQLIKDKEAEIAKQKITEQQANQTNEWPDGLLGMLKDVTKEAKKKEFDQKGFDEKMTSLRNDLALALTGNSKKDGSGTYTSDEAKAMADALLANPKNEITKVKGLTGLSKPGAVFSALIEQAYDAKKKGNVLEGSELVSAAEDRQAEIELRANQGDSEDMIQLKKDLSELQGQQKKELATFEEQLNEEARQDTSDDLLQKLKGIRKKLSKEVDEQDTDDES